MRIYDTMQRKAIMMHLALCIEEDSHEWISWEVRRAGPEALHGRLPLQVRCNPEPSVSLGNPKQELSAHFALTNCIGRDMLIEEVKIEMERQRYINEKIT